MSDTRGLLVDPTAAPHIVAVLVKKLGGKVVISQEDMDSVCYDRLEETFTDEGVLELVLIERPAKLLKVQVQ